MEIDPQPLSEIEHQKTRKCKQQSKEIRIILPSYAVVEKHTMVIELLHASSAFPAMKAIHMHVFLTNRTVYQQLFVLLPLLLIIGLHQARIHRVQNQQDNVIYGCHSEEQIRKGQHNNEESTLQLTNGRDQHRMQNDDSENEKES